MREIIFDRWHKDRGSHFDTLLRHLIETSNPVIEEDIVAKLLVVIGAAVRSSQALSRQDEAVLTLS